MTATTRRRIRAAVIARFERDPDLLARFEARCRRLRAIRLAAERASHPSQ